MKLYQSLLILLAFILSSHLIASTNQVDVIYGEDNRKDIYESKNSDYVELAKSTAAMIPLSGLKAKADGDFTITGQTLESRGICASERFAKQITAASCSGFLVAENILVTAGHCIKTEADCKNHKWVFDYKLSRSNQKNINVPATSIVSCKKILERKLETLGKNDYAVIELTEKVTDRRPLAFRRSSKIEKGASIVVIGHPSGLPTKIADSANVRELKDKFFQANLDTYGGNSGSAVFNTRTSEVEGILVRGENDYVMDQVKGCQVSNKCANDKCRGEDVTYIGNIEVLKNLP